MQSKSAKCTVKCFAVMLYGVHRLFSMIGRVGSQRYGGQRFYFCFDEGSSQSFVRNFFSVLQFYKSVVCFGMTRMCVCVCVYLRRAFGLCEWAGPPHTHTYTNTHTYTGSEAERLSPLPPFDLCPQACLPARRCTVPRTLTPCSPATPHNCLREISQGRLQTVLLLFH